MFTRNRLIVVGVGLIAVGAYVLWPPGYCRSAKVTYGLKLDQCPEGRPRQVINISGTSLLRGGDGIVRVRAHARYVVSTGDDIYSESIGSFEVSLLIVDAAGKETPLAVQGKWRTDGRDRVASVKLPNLDDGDYKLRAVVKSKVAESSVDLALALYAPASIHVLTDRPLYEAGNTVQFRALVVKAGDFTPIDNRPGTWIVTDPNGEVLLEERAAAGEWGIVAGDFPLSPDADTGTWSVSWRSGNSERARTFTVEPFTLPRFRVEASSDKPSYRAGDKPVVSGSVVYSSGAPVAKAAIEIEWRVQGAWPPPTEWLTELLPKKATSAANGRFELELPQVPADLRGRVTLQGTIKAVDPAGDRVEGSVSVLLSEDAIQVSAITELSGGLVENTNNRVYLRVSSADGQVLRGAKINVKKAWSAKDEGIDAELDDDGVARIQIDPGRAVPIKIPPMPVRKQPRRAAGSVSLSSIEDLVFEDEGPIADRVAIDKWLAPLASCGKWMGDETTATVALRVSKAGAIGSITLPDDDQLTRCVGRLVRTKRLPANRERVYVLTFEFTDPALPSLSAEFGDIDELVSEVIEAAMAGARDCLPTNFEDPLPWSLFYRIESGSKKLETSWIRSHDLEIDMPRGVDSCISRQLAGRTLSEPAESNELGVVRFEIVQPESEDGEEYKPQATIMIGYELLVTAEVDGVEIGSTKLRMEPGSVPMLRLRADPVLASPGDKVTVTLIRGPDYTGAIPKTITVGHRGDFETIKVDKKSKAAVLEIPKDARGWYELSASGARALVFVQSNSELSLSLHPADPRYAPASMAKIEIKTEIGGKGARAAVGLFGIDDSMSQLATLAGPDELASVRPEVTMSEKPFGVLDAQALVLGRIRGKNAAEAIVMRVSTIPTPADLDVVVNGSAVSDFDPMIELTDHFYIVLVELHVQVRKWERDAPAGEMMSPQRMKKLWNAAIDACTARGDRVEDAFGRKLRLHWLPLDLLSLTDPSQVVVDGTRLPEDVENWTQWVMRNRP